MTARKLMSELSKLVQMIPNSIKIKFVFKGVESESCFQLEENCYKDSFHALFDNIEELSLNYQVGESNTGFICNADWKQLKKLTIWDLRSDLTKVVNVRNAAESFSPEKWNRTFPELTQADLNFGLLPFPYGSWISLLFGSPNLISLKIANLCVVNKVLTNDFDVEDFKKRTKKHSFKLAEILLINVVVEKSLRSKIKMRPPIIPFKSLIDLLDASPLIQSLQCIVKPEETQILMERYGLVEICHPDAMCNSVLSV